MCAAEKSFETSLGNALGRVKLSWLGLIIWKSSVIPAIQDQAPWDILSTIHHARANRSTCQHISHGHEVGVTALTRGLTMRQPRPRKLTQLHGVLLEGQS